MHQPVDDTLIRARTVRLFDWMWLFSLAGGFMRCRLFEQIQTDASKTALQQLADEAQELDMGYGSPRNTKETGND